MTTRFFAFPSQIISIFSACQQFRMSLFLAGQCFGGIGYLQHCQPGLVFNENTLTCDFPSNIPCCQG